MIEHFRAFSKILLFGSPIALTFLDYVGYVARIEGVSMQPLINTSSSKSNDWVFVNKWSARNFDVHRGDIVALRNPHRPREVIIKRIIGLEGDTVTTERFVIPELTIPKGHCWVEGDNHNFSFDSNNFGPVPVALITAKIPYIIWPLHRRRKLPVKAIGDDRLR